MFDYKKRVLQLSSRIQADAVIITSMPNIRYYSGFTGDSGILLLSGEERHLFTDSRYREQAQEQAAHYTYHEFLGETEMWSQAADICQKHGWNTLGFEEGAISYAEHQQMQGAISASWTGASAQMERQRALKDQQEQEYIQAACRITDQTFAHMLTLIQPGMREVDIALELEYALRKHGADDISFKPIVASGPNGSRPHAIPSARALANGDLLTMDFGCTYRGYCSDMTRTIAIGDLAEKAISVYNIVLEAQQAASEQMRPGMSGRQVDAIARDIITAAGYGECFGHGLGHSLGLEVHENPRFSRLDDTLMEPGMVMTIEPGIYLDGQFGLRIEDTGLVTETGFVTLEHSPRELIYI